MSQPDYTLFYKKRFLLSDPVLRSSSWDFFISCFDRSERVRELYDGVHAREKLWLISPRYNIKANELPTENKFISIGADEAELVNEFFKSYQRPWEQSSVCIDITGFLKPELLYMIRNLSRLGVSKVHVLYSEPSRYALDHLTRFTNSVPLYTRAVFGFEGAHVQATDTDTLVIGVGYDDDLLSRIAKHKTRTKKVPIFCLPSLQADMYQQSRLRASMVKQDVEDSGLSYFAPANDPFVTAQVLQDTIDRLNKSKPITNLYLSPLGTKAQALGFALYYLYEKQNTATSIIYPFTEEYTPGTSRGISKVWLYTVELP